MYWNLRMEQRPDGKTYPIMSERFSRELLRRLNGEQILTLVAHFGADQVIQRMGYTVKKADHE